RRANHGAHLCRRLPAGTGHATAANIRYQTCRSRYFATHRQRHTGQIFQRKFQMSLLTVVTAPPVFLQLKWTALLVFAWCAQALLRRQDARWRLILWRSVLCFGLLLPFSQFAEFPGIKIP